MARRDLSEQESLASLIGDSEPLNTSEMIWAGLKSNLNSIGPISDKTVAQIKEELEYSEEIPETDKRRVPLAQKAQKNAKKTRKMSLPENVSTEKLIISLFDIHDVLVDSFEVEGMESPIHKRLIDAISHLEDCIRYVGGTVDAFDPMNHVSGLDAPDFFNNAQKVIETTAKCYKMGKVIDSSIEDNGKIINIAFYGSSRGVKFNVIGRVFAESWAGNEAIDYIYTPGEGKMSVKAFENGKWTDKSDTGNYEIKWTLEEEDLISSNGIKENKRQAEKNIDDESNVQIEPLEVRFAEE